MNIPQNVVDYHAKTKELELNHAIDIFKQLELYLNRAVNSNESPTLEVDSAWHSFLIHTREYKQFCESMFGEFIHHTPIDKASSVGLAKCGVGSSI